MRHSERERIEAEISERLKDKAAADPRDYETRARAYKLLCEPDARLPDSTFRTLAAVLGVGAQPHWPVVAPIGMHREMGAKWVRATILDGMRLFGLRNGIGTDAEYERAPSGLGYSGRRLAKMVGVSEQVIRNWRKGEKADDYRAAVEHVASNMVLGPGAPPDSDRSSSPGG